MVWAKKSLFEAFDPLGVCYPRYEGLHLRSLGCSGDLAISRLGHGPSGASCGELCGPIGDTKWTY